MKAPSPQVATPSSGVQSAASAPASSLPILELKDIGYHIQSDTPILQNISLSLQQGESLAIVGRNGSGKSTLGRIMAGLLEPKSGERILRVDARGNNDVGSAGGAGGQTTTAPVGMVFQNPDNQLVGSVVEEDMRYGMENYGIPLPEQEARITRVLEKLGISALRNKFIATLSGGQKQIVALAGMLVLHPKVLIFDEVTSMVDPWIKERIMQIFKVLKEHFTLIVISHDPDLVAQANRVVVLDKGSIVGDMTPLELYYQRADEFDMVPPTVVTLTKSWQARGYAVPKGFSPEKLAEALCQLR